MPENTTKSPLRVGLGPSADANTSRQIEAQEMEGQQQLIAEAGTQLPCKINGSTVEDLTALGFKFADYAKPDDPLFRTAELPPGWKLRQTASAMWTDILDETGKRRGAIFYKAAFYDRDAFLSWEA